MGNGDAAESIIEALEASARFRRDSWVGRIFHPGKVSYREISPTDSLHVLIGGGRVSAHVDDICPLHCAQDGSAHYSWTPVFRHNIRGLIENVGRRIHGLDGLHRCHLVCESVWVDEDGQTEPVARTSAASGPDDIAFSLVDEAVQLLEADSAPWSIQLEARVAGRLDESRLTHALDVALDAHPMARARRVISNRWLSRDRWAFPSRRPEVLRIVDCFDDDQLAAARAELQSLPSRLSEAQPLRAWLVRHPGGDVLMLNVHHAAMDGFGALRVMRSIARAYAGIPDPEPMIGFEEARQLPARLVQATGQTRLRRALVLVERLRDLVAPPARIASDGGSNRGGYGFQSRVLTTAQTDAVLTAEHPGTVNDLLLAALHLSIAAWNSDHGTPCGRIAALVPANMRPREWREDVAGNFALPARVSTGPRARRSRRAVLAAITEQTSRKKQTGMGGAFLELLRHTDAMPLWLKAAVVKLLPLTGDRLVDTTMFSNLGPMAEPLDFGAEAGEATEIWFSPPARMPLGVSVGVITSAGQLHLVFRHRHDQCGNEAAGRFADAYMAELLHLTTLLSPRHASRRPGGYGLGLPPPVSPAYRSPIRRNRTD